MKVLKIVGIVALILFGIYVIVAAVAPSSLVVEKSISVNAPASAVFNEVNCFDKWPAWSAWDAMDSTMANEYSENPCGLDAWNSWVGDNSGVGKQVILEVTPNEYIKTSLVFGDDPAVQTAEWFFEEVDGVTKVTWNFIGSEVSFFKRPGNLIGEYFVSSAYVASLAALKEVAEAAPEVEESAYEIKEVELEEVKYLLVSGDVKPADIGAFYGEKFGLIMGYLTDKKVEMGGHPSGLFYSWTDTLAKMSAAIPVASDVVGTKDMEFRVVAATRGLQIDYYGAYDKTEAAHYAMDDYLGANGLELVGAVREVYVTDPMSEPDTSKWLTQIIYPVGPTQ
ncbi:MAG: GyrI-like domain-containing protein [Flavobacteriales bacterium]|nr:GyrI-like domain-containing protein [Flavobacteriales bacterium]